jgi:quinol monooxygenase YgiN
MFPEQRLTGCAIVVAWSNPEGMDMYGLIGRMIAAPGKREELLTTMLEGNAAMPGCTSYVIARDPKSEDGLWITEVWDSKDSHDASLQLPHVQVTIAKARPIIAGFDQYFETEPLGGIGLSPA